MTRTLLFAIMTLAGNLIPATISSQDQLTGRVTDPQGIPLEFVTVLVLQASDSSFVKAGITGENGTYAFSQLRPGDYRCEIAMVGYTKTMSAAFRIEPEGRPIDLGLTRLSENAALNEVVVTARKALIEIHADKLVFNVAGSPGASGTNGLELLGKAPGVTVDMDNNISLQGKGGVQIYINGIQTRLSGNDLATMLQSISSDNVDNIEIITNPSAKYDAEGNAGIINIRLKKNVSTGFNGNLTSSVSKGNYFRNNHTLTLNYGGEKIKTSIDVGRSEEDIQDDFLDTKEQNNFLLGLRSAEIRNRTGYNIGLGLDALLSEKHTLSFSGRAILNHNDNALASTTSIAQLPSGQLLEILSSQSLVDLPSHNINANLSYRYTPHASTSWGTDLSIGSYTTDRHTDQPNTLFGPDGMTILSVNDQAFDANTSIGLFSLKTDYEKTWDRLTFSTGAKYAHIDADNRFAFFTVEPSGPVPDPTKSNDFTYEENVIALYAILSAKLGDAYTLNAGLRMENTSSRGRLLTDVPVNDKDVPRDYTDVFPNVGLSFNDQELHSWSISIGRRITRPNYQDLNPFESPLSQLVVWKGNPFLRPNYIMNYQVSYAYKQKLTISSTYSVTRDFFATIFEATGENGQILIPRNMDRATHLGVSISYPLEVSKAWEFVAFLDGAYRTFMGNLEGTVIDLTATTYTLRMQNSLKLPWGILMDLTGEINSDWIWRGSIRVRGNPLVNGGLRKDFFDKRLQVRITGNDILRTNSDFFYNGNYGGILVTGSRTFDNHRFGAGLTFKFGNQKLKTRKKSGSALDDELNRLQNSQ